MSNEELKQEIIKLLDHLPDKTLHELLSFLKNLGSKQTISLTDSFLLGKILSDDQELLEKLAK
jgi:hypothetical protein